MANEIRSAPPAKFASALASINAARKEVSPEASSATPSPGFTSTVSAVVFTVNSLTLVISQPTSARPGEIQFGKQLPRAVKNVGIHRRLLARGRVDCAKIPVPQTAAEGYIAAEFGHRRWTGKISTADMGIPGRRSAKP